MPSSFSSRYANLVTVVDARRRHLPVRLGMCVVMSAVLNAQMGWNWVWLWAALYIATQLLEVAVLRPSARDRWSRPSPWRMAMVCAMFFVTASVLASMSAPLWQNGGRYGPALSVFLLAGAVMNLIIISRGSRTAFVTSALPYLIIGVTLMVSDPALPSTWRVMTVAGALLMVASYVSAWRQSEKATDEARRTTAALDSRRAAAEAAAAAKSAFVAMVSHELRTPITAILAGAAEMERHAERPADRSHAALILDAARMMRGQLNDLLDLAKIEAGRMSVEASAFDLRALALASLRFWGVEARKKGVRLRIKGASRLPTWVEGDPTRLRQIVNNLLSNAIKFTDAGSVILFVEAAPQPDGGHALRFEVADSGPGLTPDQLERLFTPFDQLGVAVARTHGGTGLGLAISRELALVMGGDLTASSELGHGAVFTLTLPLRPADPAMASAPVEEAASPELASYMRILVVDDHEINRRALDLLLQPLEAQVTTVDSGAAALEALGASSFDLVLMDVNMPGINGHETTRRLRAGSGFNRRVPVLAVTASASPADLDACILAGMNDSVGKPIEAGELYSAIARVMAAAHAAAESESEAA